MKRLFDFIFSIVLLVFSAPFIAILALVVRGGLGSPVFFRQVRPGLHGKPFSLYKLRTMIELRDANGNLLPDELRLTPLGKFIRRTSLDELPQLWNVLRGDMSLVGPRPLLMEYLSLYSAEQAKRHLVRPGITGWAQVNGRNAVSWEQKFELDVWYATNHNFWLDIKILGLTIIQGLTGKGVSSGNHVTMSKFKGSSWLNDRNEK